jgi:tRNA(Arg) A34 adenosine deaminase TadA
MFTNGVRIGGEELIQLQLGRIIMNERDEFFLRRAIQLAKQARENGQEPFGAVLVKYNEIVAEGGNQIYATSDPTAHAENALIRDYCQRNKLMNLEGFSLYCSTEPCMLCSGAVFLARITKIVFSVSQKMLQKISGGTTKTDCRTLLKPHQWIEIIGPVLIEEGLKVLEGYQFEKSNLIS